TATLSSTSTITFPSGTSTPETATITSSVFSVSVTTTTEYQVPSDLSFVLTASSLQIDSQPTTTSSQSFSDPDQVTTSISDIQSTPATTFTAASLPTNLPSRIFPKNGMTGDEDLTGYTFISIAFSTATLGWVYVTQNSLTSSQILAYTPAILVNALGLTSDQVMSWCLQVNIPSGYENASDAALLQTMWTGYIPSDEVDTLASLLRVSSSLIYTDDSDPVAHELASQIQSAVSLFSVSDPNSSGSTDSSSAASGSTSTDTTRQDAIIGVVSALGAIAVLVLLFLVYRTVQRRRELAHRRLSDPPDTAGIRPAGRDFDQDTVGGQRRRSFFYAEDSLRGFQGERPVEDSYDARTTSPSAMTQRRAVMPSAISAPILRESSMNW
ncbi:uncharacterized protein EV420DRAFT_1263688, partial [Desarmillaria tabescens]